MARQQLLLLLALGCFTSYRGATGLVHISPSGRTVTLRSPTQRVIFARAAAAGEYLLNATQVLAPTSDRWLTVFDTPTPIVAGSAAWDLRPTAIATTWNDSTIACVIFTGGGAGAGSGSFWINACLASASDGLVSFDANLHVTNDTRLGPSPEPQVLLRRSSTASVALDQGPPSSELSQAVCRCLWLLVGLGLDMLHVVLDLDRLLVVLQSITTQLWRPKGSRRKRAALALVLA